MVRKILFIVFIIVVAGFGAYRLGLFNKKTESVIEETLDGAETKARESVEKIKSLLEDE